MPAPRAALPVLAAAGLAAAVAGCGTSGDQAKARATVERFYTAVRHHDGAAACRELSSDTAQQLAQSEGKPCAQAVTGLSFRGGRVTHVHVWITSAQVELVRGESEFLGKEGAGWKISALACQPKKGKPTDDPMDCQVEA